MVGPPLAAVLVGGKMNSLNEKRNKNVRSLSLILLGQIKKNQETRFFFNFMISVTGDHFVSRHACHPT